MTAAHDTALPVFRNLSIEAGDIVLVRSNPSQLLQILKRYVNINGQRVLATLRASPSPATGATGSGHSHVMLGIGEGLVIHADGHRVTREVVSDALKFGEAEADSFTIYRKRALPPATARAIAAGATRYFDKCYRFTTFFGPEKDTDTTQFCSRLVAYAYRYAHTPLTPLNNNKVLPLDIFRICQEENWLDVTHEVIEAPLSEQARSVLDDVSRELGLPPGSYLIQSSATEREALRLNNKVKEHHYRRYGKVVKLVQQMEELSILELERAMEMLATPQDADEDFAADVANTLGLLPGFLETAVLPTAELLFEPFAPLNYSAQDSPYEGLPAPAEIRASQLESQTRKIYTALLLAEFGIFALLWQRSEHERFSTFAPVAPRHIARFEAAVAPTPLLEHYASLSTPFSWVPEGEGRQQFQLTFSKLVLALKLLALLPPAANADRHRPSPPQQ